jgi:hypothetical protein
MSLPGLGAPEGDADMRRGRRRAVRDWTMACLGISDAAVVVVTEVACFEQQCAPREVLIAVFPQDGPRRQVSIHRALNEIVEADVRRAWGVDDNHGIST